MKLLFATTHSGKLKELAELAGADFQIASLSEFPGFPEVEENGATFEENARLKADAYAKVAALPALADDSGLCVDALGGRPGVLSARYAGTDAERVAKLLQELEGVPSRERTARFECALCLALPSGRCVVEIGKCSGVIAEKPRGTEGFGYDPVFYLPSLGKTMAELTRSEKSRWSHRGNAYRRMLPHLRALAEGR